ncbi:MAG: hypothetical protein H8D96_12120 [Desulfobacterales bacterium]|uniref:DUF1573 domain-containing protein n=1 Tax=Candidatus Desulfatibia vada TaxID=2841696 RepID=A0A8J6TKY6_9BACT|nr:hypothetical protein [Candidatus Desulfatibia vada]
MKLIRPFLIVIAACMLFSAAGSFGADQKDAESPSVYFPTRYYTFKQVVDGTEIVHDFILQNKGDATLKINKVTTD